MLTLAQSCSKHSFALIALRPALGQPDTPKDTNSKTKTPIIIKKKKKKMKMEGQVFFWVCKLEPVHREGSVGQNGWARREHKSDLLTGLWGKIYLCRGWTGSPISFCLHSLTHNHSPKPLT